MFKIAATWACVTSLNPQKKNIVLKNIKFGSPYHLKKIEDSRFDCEITDIQYNAEMGEIL
jgi:hypothetical protein